MLEKHVIVELSPSRLSAAVWHRGRVLSSAVERHDAARFREDWLGAVQGLRAVLKGMVDTLGIAGRSATVIYHSPSAVCGVFSCPVSAGRAASMRAARLAVAEAASFPVAENPLACTQLAIDASSGGSDSPPLAHTLGIADAEGGLETLAEWVRSSGLSPVGFVPAGAVRLWETVGRALSPEEATALIVLHIGEHASVLALSAGGRLKLVRQLGFGTEVLAENLARVLAGANTTRVSAAGRARTILNTIGIPSKDQLVDADRGLTGAVVLPVIQPLLQRLLIEAKQSLRFGLTDTQRSAMRLLITGPGAQVPGLGAVVAAQTGASLATPGRVGGDAPIDPRRARVALAPRTLRSRLHVRAASRGLWTGGAAAAAFIAYQCFDVHTDLARVRTRLSADRATLMESSDVSAMVASLADATRGLADARRRMDASFAGATDWGAVLTGLAEQTPDTISLGTIELTVDRDRPICRLRGLARSEPDADPATAVRSYLDGLARLPIVRECRLGSTQRVDEDRRPRQTFIITLTLVDLPPILAYAAENAP